MISCRGDAKMAQAGQRLDCCRGAAVVPGGAQGSIYGGRRANAGHRLFAALDQFIFSELLGIVEAVDK